MTNLSMRRGVCVAIIAVTSLPISCKHQQNANSTSPTSPRGAAAPAAAANESADKWQKTTVKADGFEVEMPGTPIRKEMQNHEHKYQVTLDKSRLVYLVAVVDLPRSVTNKDDIHEALKVGADSEMQTLRATSDSEKYLTVQGNACLELRFHTYDNVGELCRGISRFMFVGSKAYELGALMTSEHESETDRQRFLNSFKLGMNGS